MNLRVFDQFPNWPLALEFLKRSPLNFMLTSQQPPDDVSPRLKNRIILWGLPGDGTYLTVPKTMPKKRVKAICRTLLEEHTRDGYDFSAVRNTNFMSFLRGFSQTLTGKFKLADVAQALCDKTYKLFEADGCAIMLPKDPDTFYFAVVTTDTEEVSQRLDQMEVPSNKGLAGWIMKHRRSVLVNNENRALALDSEVDQRVQFHTRELLAAPVMMGEEVIGILQVVSRRNGAFQKSDLQVCSLVAAIIASFIDKARLYDERLKLARMERELEIGRQLQLAMMPKLPARIGPFALTGESRQIGRVGGDFWDVISLNRDESLVILGDVSGHGLSAALVMSAVRTASRVLLPRIQETESLVEALNLLIHKEFGVKGHYATLLFIFLNHAIPKVQYLRAGHEYPIVCRDGVFQTVKQEGSWPLGLFPFRQDDHWYTLEMKPGDSLLLYTDGVLDGLNEDEPMLAKIFNEHVDLADEVDAGNFFECLETRLDWKSVDDATMLKLTLNT